MDKEVIDYIRNYFGNLMTDDEQSALKYHMYTSKTSEDSQMRQMMIERGWINQDPEVMKLLKNGYEEFEQNTMKRIMAETPEKVFFNNCPECGKLARTPLAKQCRHCGHSWRDE